MPFFAVARKVSTLSSVVDGSAAWAVGAPSPLPTRITQQTLPPFMKKPYRLWAR